MTEAGHFKGVNDAVIGVSGFMHFEGKVLGRFHLVLVQLHDTGKVLRERACHFKEWGIWEVQERLTAWEN